MIDCGPGEHQFSDDPRNPKHGECIYCKMNVRHPAWGLVDQRLTNYIKKHPKAAGARTLTEARKRRRENVGS